MRGNRWVMQADWAKTKPPFEVWEQTYNMLASNGEGSPTQKDIKGYVESRRRQWSYSSSRSGSSCPQFSQGMTFPAYARQWGSRMCVRRFPGLPTFSASREVQYSGNCRRRSRRPFGGRLCWTRRRRLNWKSKAGGFALVPMWLKNQQRNINDA
jgi:hypothetical protein